MSVWEVFLLGVGLSMDAFAVSICKGLSVRELRFRNILAAGLYFGGFQALMPVLGWILGRQFEHLITSIDHWIAFGLLGLIGANMIREACGAKEEKADSSFSARAMLPLAVATSIDALAVGITFAFLSVNVAGAATLIGCTTFAFGAAGVIIGHQFGARWKKKAEILGGVLLILLGVKILLEHLGIISF